MRQSQLFTKTRKEAPKDEVSKNAILLSRAGYIYKEMAGVYTLLPLGLRVAEKIANIIREEMNAIGGLEMRTSVLQSKETWEMTNRWSDDVVDNWFKTTLKSGAEVGLSFTNEEAYAELLKSYISSYKDLPLYPYDFKTIFRNEARAKSGIMRGREFYWKALYSFSRDAEQHQEFYDKAAHAYKKIFDRAGLGDYTYMTFASGGTFSKYSHEFQAISEAGEDVIYVDEEKGIAINKEVFTDEVIAETGVNRDALKEMKSIEVGNIFSLAHKFSEPLGLTYKNAEGQDIPVYMGSYGIGVTRLMGTIVEILSDDNGIVWPKEVAPFQVHLVLISNSDKGKEVAEDMYTMLTDAGIEVLFDDRDLRAGEKFADSDLIGIPTRVIVGDKSLESGMFEVKDRKSGEVRNVGIGQLVDAVK